MTHSQPAHKILVKDDEVNCLAEEFVDSTICSKFGPFNSKINTGIKSLSRKCQIVDEDDDGKTTLIQSLFNLINANLGTGILAMPFVIRLGGYWGILIIVGVGIIGNYTGKNLVSLLYEKRANGSRACVRDSYADIGEAFNPRFGRHIVHIVNCIEQFSHCVLLLIMPGTVIAHTFPRSGMSESTWIFLLSLILIPTIFIRKMNQVTWTSIVSVSIAVLLSICVFLYSLTYHTTFLNDMMPQFSVHTTPISFGIVMVTFSSQAYLPSIERCMREPQLFDALMDFSYTFVIVFKFAIGIIVFLAFRDKTEQIMTMNLPFNLFGDFINIAAVILSLSFYTVPMFAVFDIIENQITLPERWIKILDTEKALLGLKFLTPNIIFRLIIVLLFIIIAAAVPHFSLLMSFVGNTTGIILVFLYPSLFYMKIRWEQISNTEVIINCLIIVFGIAGGIFGVTSAARAFYSVFNQIT